MHLHHFNAASTADATAVVRVWADIPGWVDAVVAGRPYADVDALAAYAGDLAAVWAPDDLEAALHAHPRIGAKVAGDGAEAAASRREQGSMASAADDDVAAIAAGNAAYEERFGRVFLIRAAGRTPSEMRAELERRLGNDPDTETVEATRQLAEIALLRLRTTFADEAPAEPEDAGMTHLTTHILDATAGAPATGVTVALARLDGTPVAEGMTDADGRLALGPEQLDDGDYALTFATGAYFRARGVASFHPIATVAFTVSGEAHLHVPLLLSPFAYSTYRGS